jgi:hypothetical protein
MPSLVLVGADKGGVGKTMLARALLDYLDARKVTVRAFDTEPRPGVLKRFFAPAKVVDIDELAGQVQVFDGLDQAQATVVDLRAGSLSKTLRAMRNAGLLAASDAGKVNLIVLHVLGASVASLTEIADTAALLAEGGTHLLVKNHASDGQFFEWDKTTRNSFFSVIAPAAILDVPHLAALAAETVDQRGQSFSAFINDPSNGSRMLAGVVRHWQSNVFAKFDLVDLARRISVPPGAASG